MSPVTCLSCPTCHHGAVPAPTLITVAPTGAETDKTDAPALPVTLDELVATANTTLATADAILASEGMGRVPDELSGALNQLRQTLAELREAGAVEVVPETLEAAMMIAAHVLLLLGVPLSRIVRRMQEQRTGRYRLLREFIRGEGGILDDAHVRSGDRMHPVLLPRGSAAVGRTIADLALSRVTVTALVRAGERRLDPPGDTLLQVGDVLVLFGATAAVQRAEEMLLA